MTAHGKNRKPYPPCKYGGNPSISLWFLKENTPYCKIMSPLEFAPKLRESFKRGPGVRPYRVELSDVIKAWFPNRRKRRGRPSIDRDMMAMHRGYSQKLN